uniref:FtsX-like permease family protein n=1 Tax=Candidatus Kentrum sp. DK TaxID=2126562 RepID=A0A450TMK6_9GAMM|nr:MAG: FtsX-like permease family protein [Candidatus Kentron sp. DK]
MNLLLHVFRTTSTKLPRLASIAVIMGLAMGIHAGTYSAIDGLIYFVQDYYASAHMADMEIRIVTDDAINLPDFSSVAGVSAVERRLMLPGVASFGDKRASMLLIGRPNVGARHINAIRALSGNLDDVAENTVALDRNCADFHHLRIGDDFNAKVGEDHFTLRVAVIGESPEFLIAPANPAAFLPTDGSLCVGFLNIAWLHKRLGFDAVNDLLFRYRPGTDHEKTRRSLITLTRNHSRIEQVLRQTERFDYLFLDIDLDTFRTFLPIIIFVFSLSGFFIILFLGFQWVSAERGQIGMMMALGFSARKIAVAYAFPGLGIFAMSVLCAWPLSYVALYGFGLNFAAAISMPKPELSLLSGYFIGATGGAAALVVLALAVPLASIFRLSPMEAVREGTTPEDATPRFAGGVGTGRLPIWIMLGIRNTIRRPFMSLVTILAIAACLGVTISFSITRTSIERTAIDSFKSDKWIAIVDLSRFAWTDQLEPFYAFSPKYSWSGFVRGHGFVRGPDGETNIFVTGVDMSSGVKTLKILEGSEPVGNSIVVEAKLARSLSLRPGDDLEIFVEGKKAHARISGIHSGSFPGEVWTDISFAQSLFDRKEQISGLFYLGESGSDGSIKKNKLMALPDVIGVFTQAEAIDAIVSISSEIWVILHLATLFSVLGTILFVYSNFSFSILSREIEYSMMGRIF